MPSGKDDLGIPTKGSALQLAYYVNCDREALDARIRDALSLNHVGIQWTSPLAAEGLKEYADTSFLERIGRADLAVALSRFWPPGGSVWDALARIGSTGWGFLLVEAKANTDEMRSGSGGCSAGRGRSGRSPSAQSLENRDQIVSALRLTREALGVPDSAEHAWLNTHCYQHANRPAHLAFFRARGEHAWLVHLYFTGDTTHQHDPDRIRPTTRAGRRGHATVSGRWRLRPVFVPAEPHAYALLRKHMDQLGSFGDANSA